MFVYFSTEDTRRVLVFTMVLVRIILSLECPFSATVENPSARMMGSKFYPGIENGMWLVSPLNGKYGGYQKLKIIWVQLRTREASRLKDTYLKISR